MKRIINKVLDVLFNLYVNLALFYFKHTIPNKKIKLKSNSVMALPYYSKNYAGGHSRIANWKEYFTKDEINYDVFWASENEAFIKGFYSKNPFKRYFFFFNVLHKRLKLLKDLKNYQAIWIQRAFIPFYPFKNDKFESLVVAFNANVIIDFYDADYESNYNLTINAAKKSAKVTVASNYLYNFFKKINPETHYLPFALNHKDYSLKKYNNNKDIIIGWMGSPENFENILLIEEQLVQVEKLNSNVNFVFICRDSFEMKLKKVKFMSWGDDGFDYHETISSFDIGLAPMMEANEENLAKTAFKSLEYMSSGLPFVSSPWGIPMHLIHNENVLIATNLEEWTEQVNLLSKNIELRKRLGQKAYETLVSNFSYAHVYDKLKKILLNK